MLRFRWNPATRGTRSNLLFSSLFQELFSQLCERVKDAAPAVVCGVRTQVNLTPDDQIELICTAQVVPERRTVSAKPSNDDDSAASESTVNVEMAIQRNEESEMRMLQSDIETNIQSLFHNELRIGQNLSTVIFDRLSNEMRRKHMNFTADVYWNDADDPDDAYAYSGELSSSPQFSSSFSSQANPSSMRRCHISIWARPSGPVPNRAGLGCSSSK